MQKLKPDKLARKKLEKRARDHIALANNVVPKHLQKTPSQKKSERAKIKDLKRTGIERDIRERVWAGVPSDCRGCTDECKHSGNLELCDKRSLVLRCKQCGQKVRFRVIVGVAWEYCPVCMEGKK